MSNIQSGSIVALAIGSLYATNAPHALFTISYVAHPHTYNILYPNEIQPDFCAFYCDGCMYTTPNSFLCIAHGNKYLIPSGEVDMNAGIYNLRIHTVHYSNSSHNDVSA